MAFTARELIEAQLQDYRLSNEGEMPEVALVPRPIFEQYRTFLVELRQHMNLLHPSTGTPPGEMLELETANVLPWNHTTKIKAYD